MYKNKTLFLSFFAALLAPSLAGAYTATASVSVVASGTSLPQFAFYNAGVTPTESRVGWDIPATA